MHRTILLVRVGVLALLLELHETQSRRAALRGQSIGIGAGAAIRFACNLFIGVPLALLFIVVTVYGFLEDSVVAWIMSIALLVIIVTIARRLRRACRRRSPGIRVEPLPAAGLQRAGG